MQSSGFKKQVGILSIDIDGNDYWIWNEINVIEPSIVIIEYNSRLGKEKSKKCKDFVCQGNRSEKLTRKNFKTVC